MIIVVGLGNPGRRYTGTRHNMGQEVVQHLAARLRVRLPDEGGARLGPWPGGGATLVLRISGTDSNASGRAVQDRTRRRPEGPGDLHVAHADMALSLAHLRL